MIEIVRARALIAAARGDLAKAAAALGISLAIVGCTVAPDRCTESAKPLRPCEESDRVHCEPGARVAVDYFNERTWVMCRCGSAGMDGGS